ncbi:MAG: DUF4886 domain-containing protein [Bacilli bacterium]|nr:DUF4886 domain-containing protein [Bacilli bacterium]
MKDMGYQEKLRVLAIGNSFSDDAMEYLYQIAKSWGVKQIILGNLYIGGCSLELHYKNSLSEENIYEYRKNTDGTWVNSCDVALKTAIFAVEWDVITFQQASYISGEKNSYQPYLSLLIEYVQKLKTNPLVKLAWHLTWAYQQDSTHEGFSAYNHNQLIMFNSIISAVKDNILSTKALDFIIPTGTAIQNLRTSYLGDNLTRDGFHLSFDKGRFTAGLTYFKAITGFAIEQVKYRPDGVLETDLFTIKSAVNLAINEPLKVTSFCQF